jgi:hypothetical protein
MAILFLVLFLRIDHNAPTVDTYSRIEVNHYHNEWGVEVWSQLICWDWYGRKSVFHVQHWIMMKDAYQKTEEGQKKWDKAIRAYADKIKDWEVRRDFLNASAYRGDFVGGQYYPLKNFRTKYWEVKFLDKGFPRVIKSKIFVETYTQYDPEVADREFFHTKHRRGLSMTKQQIEEQRKRERDAAEHAQQIIDAIEPLLENLR